MKKTLRAAFVVAFCASASAGFALLPVIEDFSSFQENYRICDNRRNVGRINAVALGDVNGDGYDDMILGASRAGYLNQWDTGIVYIRFGAKFGNAVDEIHEKFFDLTTTATWNSDPTVSALNYPDAEGHSAGVQINGEFAGHLFGAAVAAGDFDGDGIDDIAVCASEYLGPTGAGRVYVVRGRSDISGTLDLAAERIANRSFCISGRYFGDGFGSVLAFADLDHDGRDDLIMGTPYGGSGGEVDIFYGRDFSPFQIASVDALTSPCTAIKSEGAGDRFGASLALGDVNGDGREDLIVGAPLASKFATSGGQAYVFFGADRDPAHNKPFPPLIDLSQGGAAGGANIYIVDKIEGEALGTSCAVGDFDGDGNNDLALSAPYADIGGAQDSGKVFIIYNEINQFSFKVFLDVNEAAGMMFSSSYAGLGFGANIAAGNFNGDGLDDLIMATPRATPTFGRTYAGTALVMLGRGGLLKMQGQARIGDQPADVNIFGDTAGDFCGTSIATGNVNADTDGSGRPLLDLVLVGDRAGSVNDHLGSMWAVFGNTSYGPQPFHYFVPPATAVKSSLWGLYW
jgi:hypothetical protein